MALQEAYKFDYYLNFTVSTVNGKLKRRSKSVRKGNSPEMIEVERDDPIASVFFRVRTSLFSFPIEIDKARFS